MSDDLNAQIAQKLFGMIFKKGIWWTPNGDGKGYSGAGLHPPAYTTDPIATAEVWGWLEAPHHKLQFVNFFRFDDGSMQCEIKLWVGYASTHGATWEEALCRSALALAEALQKGKEVTTPHL